MCGILGLVTRQPGLDLAAVESGRELLVHRGPDGAGLWTTELGGGGRVVLAHRRLSILDRSPRGAQPMLLPSSGPARPAREREEGGAALALIFNGEIYNYVELRGELRAGGRAFQSECDTEVLLAAYAAWGRACLTRLNGMFAFAIWDGDRGELFCARDRFGEKPFYYALDEGEERFAFASEVKALVGAGLVAPILDRRATYRAFAFGEQGGVAATIWRGVRKLLPAHALTVRVTARGLQTETWEYWSPQAERTMDDHDAPERFRALFTSSVRMRLRSDVPVGTSLSGGLDSASVACQVHALGAAAGQKAFSARMDDPALDEGGYIDAVLARTGIPGFGVRPTVDVFLAEFDRLAFYQEEPFESTSIFASYLVHRLAAQHGVVVMLDGQGADEYLAGYAHYPAVLLTDLARRGRAWRWLRERQALRERAGADPVPPRAALYQWLSARLGSGGRTAGGTELAIDRRRDTSWLRPEVRAMHAGEMPRTVPVEGSPLQARLRADLLGGHLQELLRYADRNSMAHSREVRLPFLDHRLVEYCLALPERDLYRRGESKWVLRRAMRGTVPDPILARRDKIGFVAPWAQWWSNSAGDELRERLAEAERTLGEWVTPGVAAPGSPAALMILSLASVMTQSRELVAPAVRGGACHR